MCLYVIFLGSWLPDIDWLLLNHHRSPFTHSALPFLIMFSLSKTTWAKLLLVYFGVALASHLALDLLSPANIVFIPKSFEIFFLILNVIILVSWSYRIGISLPLKDSDNNY